MIPRIHTGSSFKGAGLYYLHDKRAKGEGERLTTGRVAWTHALNTLENDPQAVLSEMRQTAFDQPYLKMTSGNRIDGRPTEKPVMTIALSWSPEQSPTRADMVKAAESYLTHMGWQEHQCLMVAHNDTKHPHVHLIVNRVHPETGMGIDDAWRKHRSHEWSLAFEREHGKVYCEKRLKNEARQRGEPLRATERDRHARHYGEWKAARDEQAKEGVLEADPLRQAVEWSALKADQRAEREGFWKETGVLRRAVHGAVRETVREEFAPDWQQYAETRDAATLARRVYDRDALRAIRHYAKLGGVESEAVKKIIADQKAFHEAQREKMKEMRAGIQKEQAARIEVLKEAAFAKLGQDRTAQYNELLAEQRSDKGGLRADQREGRARFDLLSRHYQQTANQNHAPNVKAEPARSNDNANPFVDAMQKRLAVNARAVDRLNEKALKPRDVRDYVADGLRTVGSRDVRENFTGATRETTRPAPSPAAVQENARTEAARAEQQRRDRAWHEERRASASASPSTRNEFTDAMERHAARERERSQKPRERSGIERLDRHGRDDDRGRERTRDERER